jgi:hypothetical protein
VKLLKQKLIDYHLSGKPENIPDYALHRLLYLLTTHPDLVSLISIHINCILLKIINEIYLL